MRSNAKRDKLKSRRISGPPFEDSYHYIISYICMLYLGTMPTIHESNAGRWREPLRSFLRILSVNTELKIHKKLNKKNNFRFSLKN